MPRRPPPGAPVLRRSTGTIEAPRPLLVFCEGVTEKALIDDLRAHWRLSKRLIQTHVAGDPWNVVEQAARMRKSMSKDSAEIWVAFDRDEHPHWADALDRAHSLGLGIAVSNPCIELFGVLLHPRSTCGAEPSRGAARAEGAAQGIRPRTFALPRAAPRPRRTRGRGPPRRRLAADRRRERQRLRQPHHAIPRTLVRAPQPSMSRRPSMRRALAIVRRSSPRANTCPRSQARTGARSAALRAPVPCAMTLPKNMRTPRPRKVHV